METVPGKTYHCGGFNHGSREGNVSLLVSCFTTLVNAEISLQLLDGFMVPSG